MTTLEKRIDGLNFAIEKSLRYHHRRRAHFDRLHRVAMLGVILSGSAAFATVFGRPEIFGAIAAVLGALDLVFAFSHRARDHDMLYRRFSDLAIELRQTANPKENQFRRWVRSRLEIEKDEPPTYWAVEASCYNEVTRAWEREASGLNEIGILANFLMHWSKFERANFKAEPPSSNQKLRSEATTASSTPNEPQASG